MARKTETDAIFRLHYQVTVFFLLYAGVLMICDQMIAETTVDCSFNGKNVDQKRIDANCKYRTFVWVDSEDSPSSHNEMLNSYSEQSAKELGKHKQYTRYYHWVGIAFIVQALLFCLPACLWLVYEAKIRGKRCGAREILFFEEPKKTYHPEKSNHRESGLDRVRTYLINRPRAVYVLLEISNLLIVLGQFQLTDLFLNGRFNSYGIKFMQSFQSLRWGVWNYSHPNVLAFPKLAKCVLKGPPRDFSIFRFLFNRNEEYDNEYICRLPLNYDYEVLYALLWAWFAILFIINVCNFIFRLLEAFLGYLSSPAKPNQTRLPVCQSAARPISNKPVTNQSAGTSKVSLKASSRPVFNLKVKVQNLDAVNVLISK